jgi:two-component system alkaline phosphatase synthesis response regulator PhoP
MEEKTQKILVIEDDANIRELVIWNLSEEGYNCIFAGDGREGLAAVKRDSPDLILLDVMLPFMDGFEVIKTLRIDGIKTPVIMLTAKNEETDKVLGLEFGADDYITKPFGMRELKARIKVVLRRYKTEETGSGEIIIIDNIVIDIPRHEIRVNDKTIVLTLKEFELLQILAQNRGRVLTREQLLDQVWGYEYPGETRTVDVHIRYLRRKLGEAGDQIITVRGLGYKLL